LGAVFTRSGALNASPLTNRDVRRAFKADSLWGLAAAFWLATGIWRLVAHTEKATSYYFHNLWFVTKMSCFVAVFLLELWPMVTLIRWRRAASRAGGGWVPEQSTARRIAAIGYVQAALVIAMVVMATAMARGYGAGLIR
jgi:putative membrane protein